MPDILIRGMKMPTEGGAICIYKISGNFYAARVGKDELFPLVELPPHGDLIDRDEAVSVLKSIGSRDYRREKGTICDAIKMISHAQYVPVVVPAERSDPDA